ncbi:tetratricopeptide repeat protein [uncultured Desulfosarcina sp.]|uniref:tetratricopeptide repeat protein n=1 Tax=uncultured Desulfosarcina sp. TaxID=218289 RepID=UPI003748275C
MVILISVTILFYGCAEDFETKSHRLIVAGDNAFYNRQYTEAIDKWHKALELLPVDKNLLSKIGKAYLCTAQFREAEKCFRKVVDANNNAWPEWIELGKLKMLSFDLQAAEDIWKHLSESTVNTADALIFHGDLAMLKKHYEDAEFDYRQVLAIVSDSDDILVKLAICLYARKKKTEARKIIERLVQKRIDDPLVMFQLGHYWNLNDDFDKAGSYILQAVEMDPADLRIKIRAANFFTAAGRYNIAEKLLEPILGKASIVISKEYAYLLIQQHKVDEVITFLEPLIREHPNDDALQFMLGQAHLLSGDPIAGSSEINEVAKRNPNAPQVHYLLGIAYLAGGYNQLGLQNITTSLTLDNDYSDAEVALAACYYKMREYEMAEQYAKRVVEKEPENYNAHMILGAIYLNKYQNESASEQFAIAAMLNPTSVSPVYFRAMTKEASGSILEAMNSYRRILIENPQLVDVAEKYKNLLIGIEKADEALTFFREMGANHPDNAYNYFILSELYRYRKDLDSAEANILQAIELEPRLTSAYLRLVDIYEYKSRLGEAKVLLDKALRIDPGFTMGSIRLADLHLAAGEAEKAIDVLESAYAMNRDDPIVMNNLASLCLDDENRLNFAFELAQKAYEKNHKNPACSDTLGWAFYKKKVYRQAIWYLSEAEQWMLNDLDGESPMIPATDNDMLAIVKFHLGLALVKSGKEGLGKEKLQEALDIGLGETEAQQARGMLEEVG